MPADVKDNNKVTEETLQTLPDDIVSWVEECIASKELAMLSISKTGEPELFTEHDSKKIKPEWPIFVGYPFTRTVKDFDKDGKFTGTHQELLTTSFVTARKDAVAKAGKPTAGGMILPMSLFAILEHGETHCLVCVREDVYVRN